MHASFDAAKCAIAFQVPEGMEIGLVLGLGVAREERVLAPMPADGSFAYWRDAQQVHHVPKRALSEVIVSSL